MKPLLSSLAFLLLTANLSIAQEDVLRPNKPGDAERSRKKRPLSIGLDLGINYNFFSQDVQGIFPDSRHDVFSSGDGIAPVVALYVDIPITDKLGVEIGASYEGKDFGNSETGIAECVIVDEFGFATIVDSRIEKEYDISVAYFGLSALLRYDITSRLFVMAGPVLHFQAGDAENTETDIIHDPDECFLLPEFTGRTDSVKSFTRTATVDNTESTRFGIEIGAGYRIPIAKKISIVPKAGFQIMLTEPASDEIDFEDSRFVPIGFTPNAYTLTDKTLNSLYATIGILFEL